MLSGDERSRIDAILQVPWEVLDYERWIAERRDGDSDYLFAEARARFEAEDADALRAPPDLEAVETRGQLELRSARLGGGVAVPGLKRSAAVRLLALIDGERTLAELRVAAGGDRPALDGLVQRALGSVLFVPNAVSALEQRLSGVELVRFVGTPYEIVRNYWSNMIAVRARAADHLRGVTDAAAFVAALRELHVIALLGPDLRSFYRPASRITRRGVRPGQLYATPGRLLETERGTLFLQGPRVGVALTGGAHYHEALYRSAGDAGALSSTRTFETEPGLSWGRVVTGRSLEDREDAAWFCPPRPMTDRHFESLFEAMKDALSAAEARDAARAVLALARFHWRFVRLHPFRCANQSLAMNLVNWVLGMVRGSGVPHLLLDQLALRLHEPAYERVFRLACDVHHATGTPEQRWAHLRAQKALSYALVQRLQGARSAEEALALVRAEPDAARAALILPEGGA